MNNYYNKNFLDDSKNMKQAKDILEAHASKDILKHYVNNLEQFNNAIGSEDRKKVTPEEFNKSIAYLLISSMDQSKYASLENGPEIQYSMKNNQYPKGLILA